MSVTGIDIDKDLDHMQVNENKMDTYVLVFMIRGLKSNFKPAAATYATTAATTEAVLGAGWHCGACRVERSCICW